MSPAALLAQAAADRPLLLRCAESPLCWALLAAAVGVWLILPGVSSRGRVIGGIVALIGLGRLAAEVPLLENWAAQSLFWILAGVTIIAAAATIAMRSPMYSAIWFALSLLGTAGLFLIQGAQFLAVATIVVYAGAILVTFLFVLMLAQSEGHADYDRITWGRFPAAASALGGAAIVGVLTAALHGLGDDRGGDVPAAGVVAQEASAGDDGQDVFAEQHTAHLGAQLFSRHLVSVELAGTLLLVALVGAVAIVVQGRGEPSGAGGSGHE